MVSKVEILAYYFSLVVDLYFIIALGVEIGGYLFGDAPIPDTQTDLLNAFTFGFASGLFLLDTATLKSYYMEETRVKAEPRKLNDVAFYYIMTSKVEIYSLLSFLVLLVLALLTTSDPSGSVSISGENAFNVALVVIDYVIVVVRSTLRINAFTMEKEFDARYLRDWENAAPFNIIYSFLIAVVDVLSGLARLPCTVTWSLCTLKNAPWFPDTLSDGLFTPMLSGIQSIN